MITISMKATRRPAEVFAAVLFAAALTSLPCSADQILDRGMARMAEKLSAFLEAENLPQELIVGDFTAPPRLRASGGVEISRSMMQHLEAEGVKVHDDAEYQLLGKFFLRREKELPEDDFESTCLEIEATLLDGNDEEIAFLPLKVFGSVGLQLTGQTINVSANLPEDKRQAELARQLKSAPTVIEQNRVLAAPGSPFAMEILIKQNGREVARTPEADTKNRAYVPLHRGEEYAIRVHNSAPFDAAVTLQVDGVNMFVDATDISPEARIIVRSGKSVTVPGWYINKEKSKSFEIGDFSESVAQRVGQSLGIGTVTATFSACWAPNGRPPVDEPSGNRKGSIATKQGRDVEKKYQPVQLKFGRVRSIIAIRYSR